MITFNALNAINYAGLEEKIAAHITEMKAKGYTLEEIAAAGFVLTETLTPKQREQRIKDAMIIYGD